MKPSNRSHNSYPMDFLWLLKDESHQFADVCFRVGEKDIIWAHRAVLAARSDYFFSLLTLKNGVDFARSDVIDFSHHPAEAFRLMLEYIYCGEVRDLNTQSEHVLMGLYSLADEFLLNELEEDCKYALSEMMLLDTFKFEREALIKLVPLVDASGLHQYEDLNEIYTFIHGYDPDKKKDLYRSELYVPVLECCFNNDRDGSSCRPDVLDHAGRTLRHIDLTMTQFLALKKWRDVCKRDFFETRDYASSILDLASILPSVVSSTEIIYANIRDLDIWREITWDRDHGRINSVFLDDRHERWRDIPDREDRINLGLFQRALVIPRLVTPRRSHTEILFLNQYAKVIQKYVRRFLVIIKLKI